MEPLGGSDPARIGAYLLLRRLGAGGMGRVYLGRTAGGRTVAVKVVRGELADDGEFRARFRQEVAAARLVGGRWTAPVLDADTEGERPWVASGYVAGPSLDAAVRRHGPLPVPVVHTLGAALAEALQQVHGLGLVHRDVKPSNVLLALDGPRLIDFGIARALDAATALTRSGYVVGSPGYLSPEQAAGEQAGPAGDVFSLGAVLAFAATGTAPFGEGVSAAVLLYRVLHEEPDLAGLSGPLRAAVAACLSKDPAARPGPAELRALLAPGAVPPATGEWLPPAVSAAVARSAVELLDLEAHGAAPYGPPPGAPGPAPYGPAAGAPQQWDRSPTEVERPATPPAPPLPAAPPVHAAPSARIASSPPAAGPSRSRRGVLAAVLAAAVLAAGGALWWTSPWDRDDAARSQDGASPGASSPAAPGTSGPATPSAGPSGSGASSPGAPTGGDALPAAYLGTWRGTITTRIIPLPSTFEVEFTAGRVGRKVGTTSNTSATDGTVCRGELTLLSVGPESIELQEKAVGTDPGCTGVPEKQSYRLSSSRTLHLQVSEAPLGSDPSGDLAKQG
ncbi:serine/threonine-protein kinase [Kitasatospora sp. NBC_01539]|uniref:serine/threonine-protein kinase n=1 Tax=Kitasatospora sp. NBC_01539 TaxID=2903577 RepID=UPI003860250B